MIYTKHIPKCQNRCPASGKGIYPSSQTFKQSKSKNLNTKKQWNHIAWFPQFLIIQKISYHKKNSHAAARTHRNTQPKIRSNIFSFKLFYYAREFDLMTSFRAIRTQFSLDNMNNGCTDPSSTFVGMAERAVEFFFGSPFGFEDIFSKSQSWTLIVQRPVLPFMRSWVRSLASCKPLFWLND